MHPNSSPLAEAERQLELQRQLILVLTPELYRQLALYLQVLRKGLLHSVQQACFHLATQTYPERFSAIGASRRRELQERLQALVQRCNCLLTVEQLMGLAAQLQSRQERQRRRDQQRLLLALAAEQDNQDDSDDGESSQGDDLGPVSSPQQRGSVHLGLDLPLSADLFGEGFEGLSAWLAGFAKLPDSNPSGPTAASADSDAGGQEPLGSAAEDCTPSVDPDLESGQALDLASGPAPDPEPADEPNRPADQDLDEERALGTELFNELGLAIALSSAGPEDPARIQGGQNVPGQVSDSGPQDFDQSPGIDQTPGIDPDQDLGEDSTQGQDQSGQAPRAQGSSAQASPPPSPGSTQQPGGQAGSGPRPGRSGRPPLRRSAGGSGRPRIVAPEGSAEEFQFFQTLFAMAAEGLGRDSPGLASPRSPESGQGSGHDSPDGPGDAPPGDSLLPPESAAQGEGHSQAVLPIPIELLRQAGDLGGPPARASWQPEGSLMPKDAPSLLAWWEALDGALQRRLRNLSNAVNGELVRLGITRSHLPISLLDAVLKGQFDPLPAPANLVRVHLPFGGDTPDTSPGEASASFPLGGPLDMVVLLLRPADLEFETPALRVCRRRLEQTRARLRTMAQRHRYWQRRVQALEAERQWFQDSPNPSREPG